MHLRKLDNCSNRLPSPYCI